MKEFNYTMRIALATGLRRTDRNKRGKQALVKSDGMYPDDGALSSVEELSEIDISSITPAPEFPYPQIFELLQVTLVCTEDTIYTYDGSTLTSVVSGLAAGHPWSVADFGAFIVLVNGKQVVYRLGDSKVWTVVDNYGIKSGTSVCNLNGQLIVTAPGTVIDADPVKYQDGSDVLLQDGTQLQYN